VVDDNSYLLVGKNGSVQKFLDGLDKEFDDALVSDSQSYDKGILRNIMRQDVTLAAFIQLDRHGAGLAAAKKVSELDEVENQKETNLYDSMLELKKMGLPPFR